MKGQLIIDLVRHMKARNRSRWGEDDGLRPLSKLGMRQADMHAEAMAHGEPIQAVYSSPALRCRQTIEPLASLLGLEVQVEPLLAESRVFQLLPAGADNPLLDLLRKAHPEGGRVVVCGHADTIPAFLHSLQAEDHAKVPSELKGFGGWYRVRIEGPTATIEHFEAPKGFPSE